MGIDCGSGCLQVLGDVCNANEARSPRLTCSEMLYLLSLGYFLGLDMDGLSNITSRVVWFIGGLTPQQQPGSYQGGEMMMMKSVFWWRKPEYPEETTDLRQVTDETECSERVGSSTERVIFSIRECAEGGCGGAGEQGL